jgi:hypothetical protein
MDTMWFGVDDDGHVAAFWSGEAGAVPADASEEIDAPEERRLDAPIVFVRDTHEGIACLEPGQERRPHRRMPGGATAIVFVTSLDAVRGLLRRGLALPVDGDPGPAILLPKLDHGVLRQIHDAGACVACRDAAMWPFAQEGIFFYEHLCDNWIAGPYGLIERPREPITARDLPASVAAGLVRIPGRFAAHALVQPARHLPCEVWGEAYASYLDVDGKTVRPLPGHEESYASAVDDLYANYDEAIERGDLVIADPPG